MGCEQQETFQVVPNHSSSVLSTFGLAASPAKLSSASSQPGPGLQSCPTVSYCQPRRTQMACHAPTDTASTAATAASSDAPPPATAAAAEPAGGELTLALVPAGGAGGSGGGGAAFRIGPEHHGYVYTETPNMTDPWHNAPVYRCSRDVNLQRHDRALFLYKSGSSHWVAVSAPAHGDDPILDGQPVFRTIDELVDPTVAGTYRWQQWDPMSST